MIRRARNPRAITVLNNQDGGSDQIPIVGKITAGAPILAAEHIEDYFNSPATFFGGEQLFMLKVKGESMIQAGIMDGDYVVVRAQDYASDGDIVIALLGNEATVKRFYLDKNAVRLEPANPNFKPIISKDVRILGKVVGLVRRID